jgi:hypothetical protein
VLACVPIPEDVAAGVVVPRPLLVHGHDEGCAPGTSSVQCDERDRNTHNQPTEQTDREGVPKHCRERLAAVGQPSAILSSVALASLLVIKDQSTQGAVHKEAANTILQVKAKCGFNFMIKTKNVRSSQAAMRGATRPTDGYACAAPSKPPERPR